MARGSGSTSPDPGARAPRPAFVATIALVACLVCGWVGTASAAERRPADTQVLDLYSVLTKRAFVNNADDRSRGKGHNPFGNPKPAAPLPTNEKIFGPFPGDEGLYGFTLYTGRSHRTRAGSAIFVCQYGFNESSSCSVSLSLDGGTLVARGPSTFESKRFTLGIVGGTSRFRDATGSLSISGLGVATQRQPVSRADPMTQSQHLVISVRARHAGASSRPRTIVRYSNVTRETFVDNDDDEARGDVNNPLGVHDERAAAAKEKNGGPFPGDEALFGFDVFSDSGLATKAGSGVYSCEYAFSKRGFCQATILLGGGTLDVAGTLGFGSSRWTMAVTGGTGKYDGLAGEVEAVPHGRHAQRLTFRLD